MSTVAITPDLIAQHQLTEPEYRKIVDILGREPNYTELGVFSVMWSEHCSYKSSRLHLKKLPTRGKLVVQGPGENAGIVDIGGGYVIAFKIESHNHPSFIEPFQGAATGVGGILRDIFTMGARPIAVLDSLRFGPLDDAAAGARNRRILQGVVAGIAHYGNCFGVPTVGGECIFEPCYNGNPLVNVFALGVAKKEDIFYASAAGVGNPVIYVGAKTGRDGIHGASMASAEFTEESKQKRPNVQVGDPFHGKAAAGSLPGSHADRRDCRHTGHGRGRPDVLDLRNGQPRRHRHRNRTGPGAAARNRHDAVRDHALGIAGAHAAGGRQGQGRRSLPGIPQVGAGCRHHRHGYRRWATAREATRAQRSPRSPIANWPTKPRSTIGRTSRRRPVRSPRQPPGPRSIRQRLLQNCWRPPIYAPSARSGSSTITWCGPTPLPDPDADAAIVRIKENGVSVAMSLDGNSRYCYLSPREGAQLAVAECCRNLATVGAQPVAATNCLNFGNPERPEIMGQLVEAIEGMSDACRFFETPITGGNVSLYNETLGDGIWPTPVIGHRGPAADRRAGDARLQDRRPARDSFGRLGDCDEVRFGGTEYAKVVLNELWGLPPALDMDYEKRVHDAMREIVAAGLAESAHDVSDGGLAVAAAECCLGGGGRGVAFRIGPAAPNCCFSTKVRRAF